MFDPAQTFNDDYLWFYEPVLTEERNRAEAAEIVDALGLTAGASILDAPCGHGRIANLLASDGFTVTGVDLTQLFLDRARADAQRLGVEVEYVQGDLRNLPVQGPFDAVVCWFTSFGYFEDTDNRRVLEQFAGVLKPGGKLLIETMHHDGFVRGFTSTPAAILTERGDDVMSDVSTFNPIRGRVETRANRAPRRRDPPVVAFRAAANGARVRRVAWCRQVLDPQLPRSSWPCLAFRQPANRRYRDTE